MNPCAAELSALRVYLDRVRDALPAESPLLNQQPSLTQLEAFACRPRVGVGCVLTSPRYPHSVLVGERMSSHGAGTFALPGGHLEYNESWSERAAAELLEECLLSLPENRFQHVHTSNDQMPAEGRHYITLFMHAQLSETECDSIGNGEPNKCVGWTWMRASELLESNRIFIPLQHFLQSATSRDLFAA